jgi:hypothetical protein
MRLSTILMFMIALFLLYNQTGELLGQNKLIEGMDEITKIKIEAEKQAKKISKEMLQKIEKIKKENKQGPTFPTQDTPEPLGSGQTIADKKTPSSEKGAPFNCKASCLIHKGVGECEADGRCSCILSNGSKIYLDGECMDYAIVQ